MNLYHKLVTHALNYITWGAFTNDVISEGVGDLENATRIDGGRMCWAKSNVNFYMSFMTNFKQKMVALLAVQWI